MGKTFLMTRILAYAKTQGDRTVSLNLQLADADILQNLERFLQWFCARVSKQLKLPTNRRSAKQIADFWDNSLGSKSNATDYFEDVILANLDRPLVIAIDELNQLFAYPNIAREFLLLLRTWSEKAKARVADSNPWHKLRLVTVHSTKILMPSSIDPSFLNTGLVIDLPEFTPAQVQDLAGRWEQEITEQEIEQLIALLGGHPYRLQLAFYYLQQQTIILEELLENPEIALAIYAEHLQQQWWNLRRYPYLLPSFTQIVKQSSPVDCTAELASQLQQMGLVHLHGLQASLACELFRSFFRDRLP
jgi:AAA-like domain